MITLLKKRNCSLNTALKMKDALQVFEFRVIRKVMILNLVEGDNQKPFKFNKYTYTLQKSTGFVTRMSLVRIQ